MSKPWTKNQQDAINSTDGSILVSAAAGSGKTAVLVQRFIDLITHPTNPVDADRLLVVTYTHAAADEMKERINLALEEKLNKDPFNSLIRRQQVLLNNANISTVHSFCAGLVRDNFHVLDIAKDFRIAEEGELAIIKEEAMNMTLESQYAEKDKEFYRLVESFSSARDDMGLHNVIERLYSFLRSHPFPKKWLKDNLKMYNSSIDSANTVWGKTILSYAKSAAEYSISIINSSLNLLYTEGELFEKIIDLFNQDLAYFKILERAINKSQWDEIVKEVNSFKAGRMSTPRGYADHHVKVEAANNRENVKDIVKNLQNMFFQNDKDNKEDIKALKPIVNQLFKCVTIYDENYELLKKNKKVADFSDLEHWTLNLLLTEKENGYSLTKIAKDISQNFDGVMVDEYQDANEVQELIFTIISKEEKNLFVVGDVKQSIYGFRQAMPEIFIRRKDNYKTYNSKTNKYPGKIILDKNFRSRKEITESVNYVFNLLMSKEVGDIEYNKEEELLAGAKYPENNKTKTEVHLLELQNDDDMCKVEGKEIAKLIMKNIGNTYISENGVERKAMFGDFVILLRSAGKHSATYVEELIKHGIPATSAETSSFFDAKEIQIIINYLRIIDNPTQDIPLLSVIMSPIYGFTSEDVSNIRINKNFGNYYSALKAYNKNDSTFIKCKNFLKELKHFRNLAVTTTVDILINIIYEKTSYIAITSVMSTGNNSTSNLRLLQEYARVYDNNESKGLSAFIYYIDNLQKNKLDLKSSVDINSIGANAVKVMSIHKSKGLEFPICILANTGRRFVTDSNKDVLIHSDLGFAIKRRDEELMLRYPTMPHEAVAIEMKRWEMSEELRVLYVAMTRAKEKLIMVSSSKNLERYVNRVSNKLTTSKKISPYIVKNATYLSDWIIMCSLLHPDGKDLRDFANRSKEDYLKVNVPKWKINIKLADKEETLKKPEEDEDFSLKELTNILSEGVLDSNYIDKDEEIKEEEILKKVKERINFKYINQELSNIPVKISASELAQKEKDVYFSKKLSTPGFLDSSKMTAMEKGTALHNFLQHGSFKNAKENLDKEIENLVNKGFITKGQSKVIDKVKVNTFLNSKIVKEAIKAPKKYKEYRFTTKINAEEVDETLKPPFNKEKILLQGAVDLAYEKDGKLIIVDYKTDRQKDILKLKKLYKKQLDIYKKAMEEATDYKVSKTIIYSIYLGDYIEV